MSRLEFTAKTKRQAYARSRGICECHLVEVLRRPDGCGAKLTDGRIRYEHILQDDIRQDNSLDNCAVLDLACWREKTDKHDLPVIAKANRIRDRARGIKRSRAPMPGSKQSPWKRTFNHGVIRRDRRT